MILHGP